ncbi:hypothetical protein LTR84_002610 [Exophiala bonariae]|uniref:PH domain-containing protein n=1 Tax=Exophiala bonariae TaxID=1690606 RepID=A0AAV9NC98_9EURO|nr:hypothetical protein LTR84_002610 [Exophiala bonariae]
MSITANSQDPTLFLEGQSGWWPSDRTARARLKAFFSRSKSENKIPKRRDHDHADTHPILPSAEWSSSTKTSTARSRSTTWSTRNLLSTQRGVEQTRSRNLNSLDPPPLIQAYSQAKLQEVLDVPSSLTNLLTRSTRRRRNSISGESPSRPSLENNVSLILEAKDSVGKHKRNWSGSSSLTKKLFILATSGHVLQYGADGLNNRLPEQILELGPQSVAFASDALPGKHWVLQISQDHAGGRATSHASKNSWTKLSFRHSEHKRLVQDFLLIFDDALTLGIWLTAIRREIELLGGLEYRPDSREDEFKPISRPVLKAQKSLPNISRLSLHLPTESFLKGFTSSSSKLLPPIPQWAPSSRNVSGSTTDSSIHTDNELDDLRDSSFSDDQSTYTTTTSVAGSIASRSPAFESFSISSNSYREPLTPASTISRLSTPTQHDIGELSMYMETPRKSDSLVPKPLQPHARPDAAQHQRLTSMGGHGVIDHSLFVQPTVYSTYQTRPISTIAPLPPPGHLRKTSVRHRCETQPVPTQQNTPASSRPTSMRSRSSSSVSQCSPTDVQFKRTPRYSLFPRRDSSVGQGSAISPNDIILPRNIRLGSGFEEVHSPVSTTTSSSDHLENSMSPTFEENALTQRQPSLSKSCYKGHRIASPVNAITEEPNQPQRSPLVTERHLQTCFGTNKHISQCQQITPYTTNESSIETTLVEIPQTISRAPSEVRLSNPPRKNRHVKAQKSMPSIAPGAIPPSGPPPSGPLPELPYGAIAHHKSKSSVKVNTRAASISTSSSTISLQYKHTHAESSPSSLSTTKIALAPAAPRTTSSGTAHSKNSSISSAGSVDSVRDVTAWLSSPRIAAFTAKHDTNSAPRLDVALPESSTFGSSFGDLMPRR